MTVCGFQVGILSARPCSRPRVSRRFETSVSKFDVKVLCPVLCLVNLQCCTISQVFKNDAPYDMTLKRIRCHTFLRNTEVGVKKVFGCFSCLFFPAVCRKTCSRSTPVFSPFNLCPAALTRELLDALWQLSCRATISAGSAVMSLIRFGSQIIVGCRR